MKCLTLFCVGKLKDTALLTLENDYKKRIKSLNIDLIEVKKEEDVLASNPKNLFLLEEAGMEFDSLGFSQWLFKELPLALVIGGPDGLGQSLRKISSGSLSLSKLTFPHKIARILLFEQIYRAITLQEGHPYHK